MMETLNHIPDLMFESAEFSWNPSTNELPPSSAESLFLYPLINLISTPLLICQVTPSKPLDHSQSLFYSHPRISESQAKQARLLIHIWYIIMLNMISVWHGGDVRSPDYLPTLRPPHKTASHPPHPPTFTGISFCHFVVFRSNCWKDCSFHCAWHFLHKAAPSHLSKDDPQYVQLLNCSLSIAFSS